MRQPKTTKKKAGKSKPSEQALLEFEEIRKTLEEKVNERTQQLEQAKKEWEHTFDCIEDPVLVISPEFEILRANLALSHITGLPIRELINTRCYESFMERTEPCEDCPLDRTLSTQKAHETELSQGVQSKTYHLHSFPMSQQPPRVVHEYRDITEKKVIQEQMMLADKLSSLGLLAGGVAHEVNNPIMGILAQTQLLLMDLADEQRELSREFLESALKDIEMAALRCRKIVKDLLNFSNQKPTTQLAQQQLNDVVRRTYELYSLLPSLNSPGVEFSLAEDLPLCHLDPEKFQSVILNLLVNARDATGKTGTIRISTGQQEGEIFLVVEDDGCGISKELQEKIFAPFFTTKEKGLGTGLGLYILEEIVKEHHGSIVLESEPGQGSKFSIFLPFQQ